VGRAGITPFGKQKAAISAMAVPLDLIYKPVTRVCFVLCLKDEW
jgi:hypothetical protein